MLEKKGKVAYGKEADDSLKGSQGVVWDTVSDLLLKFGTVFNIEWL